MKYKLFLFPILFFFYSFSTAQETMQPEPQISFVRENKPHSYYVRQAELWWEEVQKDQKSEDNWYNYYRACRSAQALANWSDDFLKASPALRKGADIVQMMEKQIPDTFTYFFVKGSTGGASPAQQADLKKAYAMNPHFVGIHANMVTIAESTRDMELRQEVNEKWYLSRDLSPGLMHFGFNALQSVAPDGILLTQHDNDTYPLWMLQDVQEIRRDVWVINIDFLLVEEYRQKIFTALDIPPFVLKNADVDINEYEKNWKNVVQHILGYYQGKRPLHISRTVSNQWYEGFENQLFTQGLALVYAKTPPDLSKVNLLLYENALLWDALKVPLVHDPIQARLNQMNESYLAFLKIIYDNYKKVRDQKALFELKPLTQKIIEGMENHDRRAEYEAYFR